jgi:hypothetical protein
MSQLKKLKSEQTVKTDRFNTKFLQEDAIASEKIPQEFNNFQDKNTYQEIIQSENKEDYFAEQSYDLKEADIYIDDLGINMKNLFFTILEMLVNKQNPIPYIMSTNRIQFTFAVMILLLGGLMLFFSNLMINEKS